MHVTVRAYLFHTRLKGLNRTVFYNLTALHISCDEEMFGQQWTTTVAFFPGTKRASSIGAIL